MRLHTVREPLERDLATYAVIGQELLRGRALYSDLWDHKPPLVHLSWAASLAIATDAYRAALSLSILTGVATLLVLFAAGRRVGGTATGLLAAALWTVVSGDLSLQANRPNVEVFLNLLLAAAVAALLAATGKRPVREALLPATLLALASLYKPIAVYPAALLGLAHALAPPAGVRGARRWAGLLVIGCAGAVLWLVVMGWFAMGGRAGDFTDAVFAYNRSYSGSVTWNLVRGLAPWHLLPQPLYRLIPLIAVSAWGLLRFSRGAPAERRAWVLWLGWACGTWVAVAAPGAFWPHYEQLWLPVLTLSCAWTLGASRRGRQVGLLVLALLVILEAPSYRLSADQWSARKYGPTYVEARDAGRQLRERLGPGETFYHWGSDTNLYVAARRPPPAGLFFSLPLLEGPLREILTARVLSDLQRVQPPYAIARRSDPMAPRDHPVFRWIRAHCRPTTPAGWSGSPYELFRCFEDPSGGSRNSP